MEGGLDLKLKDRLKPLFIIVGALIIGYILIALGKVQPEPASDPPPPDVKVMIALPQNWETKILSSGTTRASINTVLTSEVMGEIVYKSNQFSAGSSVLKGQVLAKIDDTDLKLSLKNAELQLATADIQYKLALAEAEIAQEAWEKITQNDEPSELALKIPQLRQAKAGYDAAKALVDSANKKLSKTDITAPYTGRIQGANIDLGSSVVPGQPLGTMYKSNLIEVELSVKDSDLRFLNIPMDGRKLEDYQKSEIIISAPYKGINQQWVGFLERVDGVIDPTTRMIKLIGYFENDLLEEKNPSIPLGLFVEAEISGSTLENIYVIPAEAINAQNEVIIVGNDNRIEIRKVSVLKKNNENVIVDNGILPGERVMVSKISISSSSMMVNPKY